MTITTLSSREFNQDASGAKRAAAKGPVFITDRGAPSHVLLTFEAYRKLAGHGPSLLEMLGHADGDGADLDIPPRTGTARAADLEE